MHIMNPSKKHILKCIYIQKNTNKELQKTECASDGLERLARHLLELCIINQNHFSHSWISIYPALSGFILSWLHIWLKSEHEPDSTCKNQPYHSLDFHWSLLVIFKMMKKKLKHDSFCWTLCQNQFMNMLYCVIVFHLYLQQLV